MTVICLKKIILREMYHYNEVGHDCKSVIEYSKGTISGEIH